MIIEGRGERASFEILRWLFPDWSIFTQVSMKMLYEILEPENYIKLSERHLNSSLDILMIKGKDLENDKKIAVRIQDNHHNTEKMSLIDTTQKDILMDFGIETIDVKEDDCENLFKDVVNYKSVHELTSCLVESGVKF